MTFVFDISTLGKWWKDFDGHEYANALTEKKYIAVLKQIFGSFSVVEDLPEISFDFDSKDICYSNRLKNWVFSKIDLVVRGQNNFAFSIICKVDHLKVLHLNIFRFQAYVDPTVNLFEYENGCATNFDYTVEEKAIKEFREAVKKGVVNQNNERRDIVRSSLAMPHGVCDIVSDFAAIKSIEPS